MTSELTGHRNRNRAVNSAQDSDCSKLEHKRHRIIYLFWSFKAFPSITSAAASGSNPTLLSLFLSFFFPWNLHKLITEILIITFRFYSWESSAIPVLLEAWRLVFFFPFFFLFSLLCPFWSSFKGSFCWSNLVLFLAKFIPLFLAKEKLSVTECERVEPINHRA